MIPGGSQNSASGSNSFAAGFYAQATNNGSFVWSDSSSASPFVSTNNNSFNVRAAGGVRLSTAGAGLSLDGHDVLTTASVIPGFSVQQNAAGAPNVIEGSSANYVSSGVIGATISGGGVVDYYGDTIANWITYEFGTVGGGLGNEAGGTSDGFATVGGGNNNVATGDYSTLGGGAANQAFGDYSSIAGGNGNTSVGNFSSVGGGNQNFSTGNYSAVGGGSHNIALGAYATVCGGSNNLAAGQFSFAGGQQAAAVSQGSFVWADSQNAAFTSTASDQFIIRAQGGVGIGTANPLSALDVNGVTRTRSIVITGGSDLAEPFNMGAGDLAKGSVVVIDPQHPGQLKLSSQAYDTRVAGVVSGANGINPGISLHQDGALAGGQNVALTGRVYVLADAANGAIEPGDLLTTAATPGHAMKVSDHQRATGAILGKAMTALSQGQGMVLVLVTLQ